MMPTFGHVLAKRGSRQWPIRYGWIQITLPWKPLSEMERLLPEYKNNLEWELREAGQHVPYRIAVIDPGGAVVLER